MAPGAQLASPQHPRRVVDIDVVVPVCENQHRCELVDPTSDEREEVEGGFVCPLGVLDYDHHRMGATLEFLDQQVEHRVSIGTVDEG